MTYGPTLLPSGFAHTMNRAEINIVYPTFPKEVHDMVGQILDAPEDRIQVVHGFVDTPVLAIQSVAMSIGGRLPRYDHIASPDMTEIGETRKITREDTFAIAKEPSFIGNRPSPHFMSVLERVIVQEPVEVEEPESDRRSNMAHALFNMFATAR